ncbi:MAG: LptF/LptG family permease [Steroidobacteraceae bacterium]
MRGVLGNYLRRRVAGQTLALIAVLTGLMQVLELLDVTTEILNRNLGLAGVARYALLRLPSELAVALPLASLLGGMSAFYAMARNREIIAMRTAGVSLTRMLGHLLPVPLLLATVQFGLSQNVLPLAEAELKVWWDSTAPLDENPSEPQWMHTSTGPVAFDRGSADGRHLRGLRIYLRGDDGLLAVRTIARGAEWTGHQWLLDGIRDLHIDNGVASWVQEKQRNWQTNLRPEDVVRLELPQPHMSSVMLADVIVGDRVGRQPLSYYQTVLLRMFTAPLGIFIMLLLAVPSATILERGGGTRMLLALALGLGFLLCDGIMSALGTGSRLPALAAALTAPVLFTLIGLAQLSACDGK